MFVFVFSIKRCWNNRNNDINSIYRRIDMQYMCRFPGITVAIQLQAAKHI